MHPLVQAMVRELGLALVRLAIPVADVVVLVDPTSGSDIAITDAAGVLGWTRVNMHSSDHAPHETAKQGWRLPSAPLLLSTT